MSPSVSCLTPHANRDVTSLLSTCISLSCFSVHPNKGGGLGVSLLHTYLLWSQTAMIHYSLCQTLLTVRSVHYLRRQRSRFNIESEQSVCLCVCLWALSRPTVGPMTLIFGKEVGLDLSEAGIIGPGCRSKVKVTRLNLKKKYANIPRCHPVINVRKMLKMKGLWKYWWTTLV